MKGGLAAGKERKGKKVREVFWGKEERRRGGEGKMRILKVK